MTLTQMQYFQAVCNYENYTKAAAALFVTQPAVSKAIRELETECGTPLLVRKGNSLTLTEAGQLLRKEVDEILASMDHLNRKIGSGGLTRRFVEVGLSTFSSSTAFPAICAEFHRRYPEIQVFSHEDSTDKLFRLLDADRVDVIVTTPESPEREADPSYRFLRLNSSCLRYCVSRSHRWARRGSITLEEIAAEPLILLSDNYSSARGQRALFAQQGLEPNIIMRTSQMFTVERFVESGAAGGYLPIELAESNKNIVALPCSFDRPARPTCIIWKKNSPEYPAVTSFLRLARELYPQDPAE